MPNYAPAAFGNSGPATFGLGSGPSFLSEQQSANLAGYTMIPDKFYHDKPCRNALGLVGGNDVSVVTASPMVDVESDLYGITRPTQDVMLSNISLSVLWVEASALIGLQASHTQIRLIMKSVLLQHDPHTCRHAR